jgi:hypothetical protein
VQALYLTVAALTVKLRARVFLLPGPNPKREDAEFLARFAIVDGQSPGTDEGLEQLHRVLAADIALDAGELCQVLSADLTERLENTIGSLAYIGETEDESEIDRNLQRTQFWRDQGTELAKQGVREPDLTKAFEAWKSAGHARYTMAQIRVWLRHAEHLSRQENPARALVGYWAIDKRFGPFEEEIVKAVLDYEDRVDAEIH